MQIPQAKRARGRPWLAIGVRAGTSVGLFAAAVGAVVAWPGEGGSVAATLLACVALMVWVSALLVDTLWRDPPGRRSEQRRAPKRRARPARSKNTRAIARSRSSDPGIRPGDYFSYGRSLYRVEHLAGERVLIEDCRTGDLLDIDRDDCAALNRVRQQA